jgi:hypothetical protein
MSRFHSLIGRDHYLVSVRTVAGRGMDPHFLCSMYIACVRLSFFFFFLCKKRKYISLCVPLERIKFEVNLYVKL